MPVVETMALWVAIMTLGAQIKGMAGTGKREKENVRLLREQADNTRKMLKLLEDKLLEDKQKPMPDPALNGVLTGLRGALNDISSSSEKKTASELHDLDQRISSVLQQYHYYHVTNNIHRQAPQNMMQPPVPQNMMPYHTTNNIDTTGHWAHVVREIVEHARAIMEGAWHANHNMEEVLHVAQLAQQVADLMGDSHAIILQLMRDPGTSWPLLNHDLRNALLDARWIVWYSQWYHLGTMPLPSAPPQAGPSATSFAGGRPPTMALWVSVVALGARIKAMVGASKREREKVRLLKEQAENTRKILKLLEDKLLEDKQRPTSDPEINGLLTGLRGALDDISSSPEKKASELHDLDQQISSVLQQYHYYHVTNNIHRQPPQNMTTQPSAPPNMMPYYTPNNIDTTGHCAHVVREIVEHARAIMEGAWHVSHNMEEVLRVAQLAQLAQQVADLMEDSHAITMQRLIRDPETSWPLLNHDLRNALLDARWIVWCSQWYHLSTMPLPSAPPQAGPSSASFAGGYPPQLQLQPAQILNEVVKKIEFCLQVLPAIG
uniref:Uncharacterized protein n=1 Tax=Leersia perrieri TaxID=77586 RepID=A0A0D9XV74_9ORYZ